MPETTALATLLPQTRSAGTLLFAGRRLRCAFGEAGLRAHKQEGDHATPSGRFRLRRILYRADRIGPPDCARLPREPIAPDDGWCDDPTHADYNRPVRLPHPACHERLWRDDGLYDVVAVLGYNDEPVQKGLGSAIFLHVASADDRPTQGCLALRRDDLLWALAAGLTEIEVPVR